MAKMDEILRHFDLLPDDAVVPTKVSAIILGLNEKTVRAHPQLPHKAFRAADTASLPAILERSLAARPLFLSPTSASHSQHREGASNVRYWHKADIRVQSANVRFPG